jgi:protease-4
MKPGKLLIIFFIISGLVIVLLLARLIISGAPIGEKVAVVDVIGPISGSEEVVNQIHKYRDDSTVKAIVVRIDSPGGSVAPVQEIYSELQKVDKPIVASLGSAAASGGYYIAAAADEIFANPGTLTGSIGVIMQFLQMKDLYEKVGLDQQVVKSGKYKDIGSAVRDLTDEERKLLQETIDDVHSQFIDAIFEERHDVLTREEIATLADGRIFSGQQALAHKLVDQLGGLQDAIARAGALGGIKGEPKAVREERKVPLIERLLGLKGLDNFLEPAGVSFRYELRF